MLSTETLKFQKDLDAPEEWSDHQLANPIHCQDLLHDAPSYNCMEKADFLFFEVEAPSGINFIIFNGSVTFSEKNKKQQKLRCVF